MTSYSGKFGKSGVPLEGQEGANAADIKVSTQDASTDFRGVRASCDKRAMLEALQNPGHRVNPVAPAQRRRELPSLDRTRKVTRRTIGWGNKGDYQDLLAAIRMEQAGISLKPSDFGIPDGRVASVHSLFEALTKKS